MNKDIDNIFKDGLQGHTEEPPAFIWDSINSELGTARANNNRIVIWRSLAAAAFIGVIFLSGLLFKGIDDNLNSNEVIGYNHSNNEKVEKEKIVKEAAVISSDEPKTEEKQIESITKVVVPTKTFLSEQSEFSDSRKSNENKAKTSNAQDNEKPNLSNEQEFIVETQIEETEVDLSPVILDDSSNEQTSSSEKLNESLPIVYSEGSQVILAQNNQKKEYEPFPGKPSVYNPTKSKSKYVITLGGQVAPGYSDKEVSGASNTASKESGIVTISGGLNVNVKAKSRWSIETGAYYTQSGQKFSNEVYGDDRSLFMRANRAKVTEKETEVPLNNSLGKINLKNVPIFGEDNYGKMPSLPNVSNPELGSPNNTVGMIDIQQELDFIEVPLLVRYHLIDSKVNLSLAGGMSTNFLVDNNVYYLEGGNKTWIGETEQINNVNYSAVFGLGLQAPIWKTLQFNLEPRLKYFMNSVSSDTSTDYKPYSIGLFTGVSFRF